MDDPAGRERRVPRSEPATALLHHMASIRVNEFVFPSLDARSRGPLSNMALATVLRRMGEGSITVHGFRSTLRRRN
jgi:integrase